MKDFLTKNVIYIAAAAALGVAYMLYEKHFANPKRR